MVKKRPFPGGCCGKFFSFLLQVSAVYWFCGRFLLTATRVSKEKLNPIKTLESIFQNLFFRRSWFIYKNRGSGLLENGVHCF